MLTLLEAAKVSRNPLAAGVLRQIAKTDQLLSQIQMIPKSGESFTYARERSLGETPFYEVGPVADPVTGAPGALPDVSESSATFDQVVVPMRAIVANVDVSNFAEEQQNDPNQQMAVQMAKKLKRLGQTIGAKLITGNYAQTYSLSAAPAGISVPASGAVGPNQDSRRHGPGSLLIRNVVDGASCEILYRAPSDTRYGEPVAVSANGTYTIPSHNQNRWIRVTVTVASLVAESATEVAVRVDPKNPNQPEWDGLQALCPESQTIESQGANGDDLSFEVLDRMIDELVKVNDRLFFIMNAKGKAQYYNLVRSLNAGIEVVNLPGVNAPVPSYRGIPILQSDWIPSNEVKGANSDLTSIYLASLSADEGFYMGVGQNAGSAIADIDPRSAPIMGVRLRQIGQLEQKDAARMRVTFYGATALGSELAVARAAGIKTATST